MAPAGSGPAAVLARGVEFRYRSGRIGLRGTDLEVGSGEIVTLLGPNGSGKSTLLRLLATDLLPTGGSLSILGSESSSSARGIRRRIGYAPDTPVHVAPLTGQENAELFAALGGAGATARERTGSLLASFGLGDVKHTPVSEYSFGMSRKLLLVEALAPTPDLLLLDEPTVGLDPAGASALRDALRESSARGASVVVASNETRDLPLWGDRIVFLHEGRIVEDAEVPALMNRLGTATRIEVGLQGREPSPEVAQSVRDLSGVREARFHEGGVDVRSSAGGGVLPELLGALLDAGLSIRDVRVREPVLSDLFLDLTGERLPAEPAEGGAAGGLVPDGNASGPDPAAPGREVAR